MNNFFSHFIVSIACPFLHEGGRFIAFKISIIDAWQGSKHASGLNFRNFSIQFTLHQELNGCGIKLLSKRDWQNLKTLVEKNILRSLQLVNTFNLPGGNVLPKYKEREISRTSPGRLLLKLIYWNKSIQSINITVTTNEYQEQPQTMIKKFPWGHTAMRVKCDFKKVCINLWPECFVESCLDIVTTYSICFVLCMSHYLNICLLEFCLLRSTYIFSLF